MADATAEFFDDLSKRGHEPLLGKMRATVRFDIVDGEPDRPLARSASTTASSTCTRGDGEADCVITRRQGRLRQGGVSGRTQRDGRRPSAAP